MISKYGKGGVIKCYVNQIIPKVLMNGDKSPQWHALHRLGINSMLVEDNKRWLLLQDFLTAKIFVAFVFIKGIWMDTNFDSIIPASIKPFHFGYYSKWTHQLSHLITLTNLVQMETEPICSNFSNNSLCLSATSRTQETEILWFNRRRGSMMLFYSYYIIQ